MICACVRVGRRLKGGKKTLYEGGTRVVGLVSGYGVAASSSATGRVSYEMFHAADWLPSLVGLAMAPDHGGVEAWRRLIPSTGAYASTPPAARTVNTVMLVACKTAVHQRPTSNTNAAVFFSCDRAEVSARSRRWYR